MELVDRTYSTFTKQELVRLTAYRAAVAAGFYTDWETCPEPAEAKVVIGDDPADQPPVVTSATPKQPAR